MPGDDDDRHGDASLFHFHCCQEIDSAYFRHAPVRHHAAVLVLSDRVEKCLSGFMSADRVPLDRKHQAQRLAHRAIVINDVNGRI